MLTKSWGIIAKNPAILLPQVVVLVLTLLGDAAAGSSLSALRLLITIVTIVADVIVAGAYPSMVKAVVDGGTPSVGEAVGKAYRRFWTLLGAGIAVVLLVGVGLIALVIPGLILMTWYAYTVPAIMYEDKGALDGMAASKDFGRDKKWSTLLFFVVVAVAGLVIVVIESVVSLASPTLGAAVGALLEVPLSAMISVVLAYAYLTHGPSAVTQTPEGPRIPAMPPPPPPQGAQVVASPPARYCASCGSQIQGDSKFCSGCGKPV